MSEKQQQPFLNAWRDRVANLQAFQQNVRICDIQGDGDQRLLIADQSQRILAYKNVNIDWELPLQDIPLCIAFFYDGTSNPPIPTVAFGCESFIYLYKDKRALFKFQLPLIEMQKLEKSLWEKQDLDANKFALFVDELQKLKNDGILLTYKSLDILTLSSKRKQYELFKQYKDDKLGILDLPTCMEQIYREVDDDMTPSHLVVGTEMKMLYIFDESGFKIETIVDLSQHGTPCFLSIHGALKDEHIIFTVLRENLVLMIRNGQIMNQKIDLISKPIICIRSVKNLLVAQMNDNIDAFSQAGVKLYTLRINANISTMERMESVRYKMQAVLVATYKQELHIYNQKNLVYTLKCDGVISAMRFGVFGREDGTLVLIYNKLGIDVKMLGRKFNFQQLEQQAQKRISESPQQDEPLVLPKKTKLFIEQSQRERDNPLPIHQVFQKDLMKLRLKTAQVYIQTLDEGNVMNNMLNVDEQMRVSATIQGLGPLFKLHLNIENLSSDPLRDLYITYLYDPLIFNLKNPPKQIPYLLPHISMPLTISVKNIDENGVGDSIKVMICSKKKQTPIIGALINMPLSELNID